MNRESDEDTGCMDSPTMTGNWTRSLMRRTLVMYRQAECEKVVSKERCSYRLLGKSLGRRMDSIEWVDGQVVKCP